MTDGTKATVAAQFGENAAAYATSEGHAKGADLGILVRLGEPTPHMVILDVATGAGHTAFVFAPHVDRVVASDLTEPMLDQVRRLAAEQGLTNVATEQADVEQSTDWTTRSGSAHRRPVTLGAVVAHVTHVGCGSAGKYYVTCDACDFNPRWEPLRADAERWAREHMQHPDRDVSGIWAWSQWRMVEGVNHAFPYGTAVCGAGASVDADGIRHGPAGTPHDPQAPMCPACEAMALPDRDRP